MAKVVGGSFGRIQFTPDLVPADLVGTRIYNGKTGEFNTEISTDIAMDMLLGPLFLRVLSGESAIDNHFAENYPKQALIALRAA